ncbi:MAG: tetratricopeptide repeat protein, partial [Thermosynechococcaceae cyanobacterium]
PRRELQLMQAQFIDALESDEGRSSQALESRKSAQESRLSGYIKLALDDSEEEQDPRITACDQELFQRYEEQDFDAALSLAQKLVQLRGSADDFGVQGLILDDLGRYEDAISSFDQAIKFKPDYHQAFYNRGVALANLGRYEDAIASFDKALNINPNIPFRTLRRAEAIFALKPSREAYTALEDALKQLTESEKNDGWQANIMLLSLFRQTQDLQQWQSHIQKLVSLFEQYQFLTALGVGLIKNCSALLSEMVSQAAAQAWVDVWEAEAGNHEEFMIPLRLLKTTVHYKQKPDDPRVLLELPTEERAILKQALGLEQ